MSAGPPDLKNAAWLQGRGVPEVFALLTADGEEARIVGGAVRDALMGRPVAEIDFATTMTPDRVAAAAEAAGYKAVPTGIEHGTITLVVQGRGFEVTTLRQDVETDGRHAVVRFGRDWQNDARRRDFTVNALSVDAAGKVYDPVGGWADIAARHIRFIGDPDRRIAEDRLRVLRLFRFHAQCGVGGIDQAGLSAAMRARNDLSDLSAERIGQEVRRIVVAPRAAEVVALMQEAGILPVVLAGVGYLAAFARLVAWEAALGHEATVAPRLAALACRVEEDVLRVTERLRLANAERDRMLAGLAAAPSFAPPPTEKQQRRALYSLGEEAYGDGVALAFAMGQAAPEDRTWHRLATLPGRWKAPVFPLGGRDAMAAGAAHGPAVGAALRAVESWWMDEDFRPDEQALRARLQQMTAAAQ